MMWITVHLKHICSAKIISLHLDYQAKASVQTSLQQRIAGTICCSTRIGPWMIVRLNLLGKRHSILINQFHQPRDQFHRLRLYLDGYRLQLKQK